MCARLQVTYLSISHRVSCAAGGRAPRPTRSVPYGVIVMRLAAAGEARASERAQWKSHFRNGALAFARGAASASVRNAKFTPRNGAARFGRPHPHERFTRLLGLTALLLVTAGCTSLKGADVQVVSFHAPTELYAGDYAELRVEVFNSGGKASDTWAAVAYEDKSPMAPPTDLHVEASGCVAVDWVQPILVGNHTLRVILGGKETSSTANVLVHSESRADKAFRPPTADNVTAC